DSGNIQSLINEDLVPIDIQISSDSNSRCSWQHFSRQISHHRSRQTCRKTDIVADPAPFSRCLLHLEKRNHRFDSSLMRCKTRCSAEVLDEAVHQQPERTRHVWFRQPELEVMHLRKTRKLNRIETCHVLPIAPQQ